MKRIYLPAEEAWQQFQQRKKMLDDVTLIAENYDTGYQVFLSVKSNLPLIYVIKDGEEAFKSSYVDGETFCDDLIYIYDFYLSDDDDDYPGFKDDIAYYDDFEYANEVECKEFESPQKEESFTDYLIGADADVYYTAFDFMQEFCPDFDDLPNEEREELVMMLIEDAKSLVVDQGYSIRATSLV